MDYLKGEFMCSIANRSEQYHLSVVIDVTFQAQDARQCPRFVGDVGTAVVAQEFQCMGSRDCID